MTERPADLPEYANEPLHEVALGVLYQPLDGFRQAHFGRYWALVADRYPRTVDRERIESEVEPLAAGPIRRSVGFKVIESAPTDRAWFISSDDSRLIQLQDDRLLVNWRRAGSEYPRFEAISDEFQSQFVQFGRFAMDESIGPIAPLQVEVSYFNRILDAVPAEFLRSPPALDLSALGLTPADEVLISRALIHEADGRAVASLTIEVQPVPLNVEGKPTFAYQFALTYRQPLGSQDPGAEIQAALLRGRDTIVRSFTELTSTTMHERWERIK